MGVLTMVLVEDVDNRVGVSSNELPVRCQPPCNAGVTQEVREAVLKNSENFFIFWGRNFTNHPLDLSVATVATSKQGKADIDNLLYGAGVVNSVVDQHIDQFVVLATRDLIKNGPFTQEIDHSANQHCPG